MAKLPDFTVHVKGNFGDNFRARRYVRGVQMVDVLRAMSTSGAILLPIVVLIIIVSIATVKRGEDAMGGGHHGLSTDGHGAAAIHASGSMAAAAPAAAKKPAATESADEISVMQVLLFGIVMFTAVMVLLLLVSVLQHS